MANLDETNPEWTSPINKWDKATPANGTEMGLDLQALVNRANYLKDQCQNLNAAINQLANATDPYTQYLTETRANELYAGGDITMFADQSELEAADTSEPGFYAFPIIDPSPILTISQPSTVTGSSVTYRGKITQIGKLVIIDLFMSSADVITIDSGVVASGLPESAGAGELATLFRGSTAGRYQHYCDFNISNGDLILKTSTGTAALETLNTAGSSASLTLTAMYLTE